MNLSHSFYSLIGHQKQLSRLCAGPPGWAREVEATARRPELPALGRRVQQRWAGWGAEKRSKGGADDSIPLGWEPRAPASFRGSFAPRPEGGTGRALRVSVCQRSWP